MRTRTLSYLVVSVLAFVLFAVTAQSFPAREQLSPNVTSASIKAQKQLTRWALGSNSNPLGQETCGEKVGRYFMLNPPVSQNAEFTCKIHRGAKVLALIGGVVAWEPSKSVTDERDASLSTLSNPRGSLDGHEFDGVGGILKKTSKYKITVERKSLIAQVTPEARPATVAASGGWFVVLDGLDPGDHKLRLSVKRPNDRKFSAVYRIAVPR